MKKYILPILLVCGLVAVGILLRDKMKTDRTLARVEALNQLRYQLIQRKVLRSAQVQQTFTVANIDAVTQRLDTLPPLEPELHPQNLPNQVLIEKYNYELYAIYGLDNREDISCRNIANRTNFLNSTDQYIKSARTVCALIPKKYLTLRGDVYELTTGTLNETKYIAIKPCSLAGEVCFNNQVYNESIKYANQYVGVDCSGFGYKDNLIVTAKHCFEGGMRYNDFYYVFGYVYYPGQDYRFIPKEDVFEGRAVVASSTSDDYQLIRTDRPLRAWQRAVLNRDDLSQGDSIYMAGHPDGLPLKLTLSATVFSLNESMFFTDLDAFHGNSGSPVFNASGEVIGILQRGDYDYEQINGGCVRYYKPPASYGEEVLRVKRIP